MEILDRIGYTWSEILDQMDWPREGLDLDDVLRAAVSVGIINIKEAVKLRNQMGGALYWNILTYGSVSIVGSISAPNVLLKSSVRNLSTRCWEKRIMSYVLTASRKGYSMMANIKNAGELIAASAWQGVTICDTEAEIILFYIWSHGYELLKDDDFNLALHEENDKDDHSHDVSQTIRDIVELCKELNEEMLRDIYSEEGSDEDERFELRKDALILETTLEKAIRVIPATERRYNVVIVEHRKKVVPVLAASWAEAEEKVREMWENGEVIIGQSDFAGIMISSGG